MADRPVQRCACGADCDWCVDANVARRTFPNALTPPWHDADTEHECGDCFERRLRDNPGAVVFECNPTEEPDD